MPQNSIHVIFPYRKNGVWMFDDEAVGLKQEPFVSGAPEIQLKTPPNCQRSTNRWTNPGAELRSRRFGPNGNSKVPLLVIECVRW